MSINSQFEIKRQVTADKTKHTANNTRLYSPAAGWGGQQAGGGAVGGGSKGGSRLGGGSSRLGGRGGSRQ